jgi:hypothetical protein
LAPVQLLKSGHDMRDFFIRALEAIVNVVVVIAAVVILIAAAAATFGGAGMMQGMGGMPMGGGPVAGVMILIGGGIYLILVAGFLYLGLGIYQNTRRSAEALERMAGR